MTDSRDTGDSDLQGAAPAPRTPVDSTSRIGLNLSEAFHSEDAWWIADRLRVGIVLLDERGLIEALNQAAADLLASERPTPIGVDFFREIAPQEAAKLIEWYAASLERGEVSLDFDARVPPAAPRHSVRVELRSFRAPGRPRCFGLLEDRTVLESERARRIQAERLATIGEMAAGVAHELNNPLTSVKTLAELLAQEIRDPGERELLNLIVGEASRAAAIVKRQLGLARAKGPERAEPVNLNEIVERAVELRRYELDSHEIRVQLDLDRSIRAVRGDETALLQVMLNLIVNSEEALGEVEGERRLILRTRESSGGLRVAVVDNGPGISRSSLDRLFDPFFTTKPAGSGLGLAIANAIVLDHGGQLFVESQAGNGSAFHVQLPPAEEWTQREPRLPARARATREAGGEPPTRALTVLVADDEPVIRLAIQRVLGERGHIVLTAADADEALQIAREEKVDVALIDAHMPGDGLTCVARLDEMPELSDRVILLSGDVRGLRVHAARAARGLFLQKPFDYDELVTLVERGMSPIEAAPPTQPGP